MGSFAVVAQDPHLTMMLNARATPPNAMKASFRPLFGIYCVIEATLSSLRKVRIGVSQNSVPNSPFSAISANPGDERLTKDASYEVYDNDKDNPLHGAREYAEV